MLLSTRRTVASAAPPALQRNSCRALSPAAAAGVANTRAARAASMGHQVTVVVIVRVTNVELLMLSMFMWILGFYVGAIGH